LSPFNSFFQNPMVSPYVVRPALERLPGRELSVCGHLLLLPLSCAVAILQRLLLASLVAPIPLPPSPFFFFFAIMSNYPFTTISAYRIVKV